VIQTSSMTGLGLNEFKREAYALSREGKAVGDGWSTPR